MKLGIDISQIVYKGTGVSRYLDGLVKAILKFDQSNEWTFFFSSLRSNINQDLELRIKKSGHRLIKLILPISLLSFLWNDLHRINLENIVGKLDYFITSDWIEPPCETIKKITVVHDLTVFRYPHTVAKQILVAQKKRLHWVRRESELIIADSQATKFDLINYLEIADEKIKVIYPGVEVQQPNQAQIKTVHDKYQLIKPFILTVGKLEPRKNMRRLIEAFQNLNDKTIDLVIVGPQGWDNFDNEATRQWSNIHLLGYVEDWELYSLYTSCLFFVYPSIWEGFGFPVIEAMKFGTPVIISNTSSLVEIAQGASLFFDPQNTDDLQINLKKMISNSTLREQLSTKGKIRASQFTWEKALGQILQII